MQYSNSFGIAATPINVCGGRQKKSMAVHSRNSTAGGMLKFCSRLHQPGTKKTPSRTSVGQNTDFETTGSCLNTCTVTGNLQDLHSTQKSFRGK